MVGPPPPTPVNPPPQAVSHTTGPGSDPVADIRGNRVVVRAPRAAVEEAARVDGAGDWTVFRRVVLPMARPALAVVGINTFLVNWNSFLYPLILTSSESMRTVPVARISESTASPMLSS